jgi:hypothetical protein
MSGGIVTGVKGVNYHDLGFVYTPYMPLSTSSLIWFPPEGSRLLGPWRFREGDDYLRPSREISRQKLAPIVLNSELIGLVGVKNGVVSGQASDPGNNALFYFKMVRRTDADFFIFRSRLEVLSDGKRWWGIDPLITDGNGTHGHTPAYRRVRLSLGDRKLIQDLIKAAV